MQTATEIIETIKTLPVIEKDKVFEWVENEIHHSDEPSKKSRNGLAIDDAEQYQKAHKWLNEHRKEYLNKWVCLEGDQLIAAGEDGHEVYQKALTQGIKVPLIHFVEEEPEHIGAVGYERSYIRV